MRTVYFIRHGEPKFPEGEHICLGRTELPLSDAGILQARAAAEAFRDRSVPVFSSPQTRALQTASAFGGETKIIDGLRERDMGLWDGMSFGEIRRQYPDLYAARANNKKLLPPGAEEEELILTRFHQAVTEILGSCAGDAIAITHSGVLSVCLGIPKPDYGSCVPVRFEREGGSGQWIGFLC